MTLNKDIVWLGSAPADEDCAQVGEIDYRDCAIRECQQYVKAVIRKFGEPPDGAAVKMKVEYEHNPPRYEVVVEFDPLNEKAVDWAYMVEGNVPRTWEEVGFQAPCKENQGRSR